MHNINNFTVSVTTQCDTVTFKRHFTTEALAQEFKDLSELMGFKAVINEFQDA
jgi:hypothetical protein